MSQKLRNFLQPERPRLVLVLGCLLSGLAHSAACAALSRGPLEPAHKPSSRVEFRVLAAQAAPPSVPSEPTTPALPQAPARAARPPSHAPAAVTAPHEPARAGAPETVDLSGVTLTAESGAFATLAGNGQSFDGPLAAAVPSRPPAPALSKEPKPEPAPAQTLVALTDLSARPVAPELSARLLDFYPEDARRRGIAGSAQVRARIDPDGRVRSASPLSETFAGFGAACRRTVLGSEWSAPRDLGGRAVATEIRYTCHFVVQP